MMGTSAEGDLENEWLAALGIRGRTNKWTWEKGDLGVKARLG